MDTAKTMDKRLSGRSAQTTRPPERDRCTGEQVYIKRCKFPSLSNSSLRGEFAETLIFYSEEHINSEQAMILINRVGPHIDSRYDHTYGPIFPEGREDVCVVKRLAEDGSSYGFDILYLVWEKNGALEYLEIANTRLSKDYLHIEKVTVEGSTITVEYGGGGSFSGKPSAGVWHHMLT
jgi:hypothetical protein